jgi:hypothetical protein
LADEIGAPASINFNDFNVFAGIWCRTGVNTGPKEQISGWFIDFLLKLHKGFIIQVTGMFFVRLSSAASWHFLAGDETSNKNS